MFRAKIKTLIVLFGFMISSILVPVNVNGQAGPGEDGPSCSTDCGDIIISCDNPDECSAGYGYIICDGQRTNCPS